VIIDYHIHAFADKIAARAIGTLQQNLRDGGLDDTAYSDGTYSDTETFFAKEGFGGVFMPIATKLSQMTICNDTAAAKNNYSSGNARFWSYGSVFPVTQSDDEMRLVLDELERIKALGLYGIKLHPDYQQFFVDDEKVFPVYEKCAELSLPIMFHAGFDPVSPKLTHATPDRSARVLDAFPGLTAIFAHMGGEDHWDEAEELLCGRDCYIDTAYCGDNMESERMERMIKKHGADRVLFGSDFPWKSPADIKRKIDSLELSDEERQCIYYKNAVKLLREFE
jgi:predicted TIM-barrel fold metal-dependent hydrolase